MARSSAPREPPGGRRSFGGPPALCVIWLFGAVALFAAPPANAPPAASSKFRFGIVAFDFHAPVPDRIAALGVGWVRGSCAWGDLEPARGVFDWDCADGLILPAQKQALFSYVTVTCTPAWANAGAGCGAMPLDIADWFAFVRQYVGRYSRFRTRLGVWNEPNLTLDDGPDARNYALLFVNASAARDSVDPEFALAGPETSHHAAATGYYLNAVDTMRAMHGLAPQDAVSVHWYPDGPQLNGYIDFVGSAAGANDVWLTETGLATADVSAQASFITQTVAAFVGSQRPWWTHFFVYRLWDGQACCTEALLNADYSSKPAFDAYRLAIIPDPPGRSPRLPY